MDCLGSMEEDGWSPWPGRSSRRSTPIMDPSSAAGASTGQMPATMPEAARHAVRQEMRQALNDTGGPITIDVEHRIASGRRQRQPATVKSCANPKQQHY